MTFSLWSPKMSSGPLEEFCKNSKSSRDSGEFCGDSEDL
jgi:hypothetical protein